MTFHSNTDVNININKLTDINQHQRRWQGHLCTAGWTLWLKVLTEHLPFGFTVSAAEVRPTLLAKEETNQGLTGCCHQVTQQATTWISRSKGICDAVRLPACFRASVRTGPALLFVSRVQGKRKDRVNRRWRGTVREKRQGWREIRWLLESPPQTTHQHKTASVHLSAREWAFRLPALRYLFINWISQECQHRGRVQSWGAAPQATETAILCLHSCCTRVWITHHKDNHCQIYRKKINQITII